MPKMGNQKKSIKTLLCAATLGELSTHPVFLHATEHPRDWIFETKQSSILGLVTGVGIPFCMQRLFDVFQKYSPLRVVNIGIAGAYMNQERVPQVGDVFIGESEFYCDIGFEHIDGGFQHIASSEFGDFYSKRFSLTVPPQWLELKTELSIFSGKGATINQCTGSVVTGNLRRKMDVDFETMEGAAVAQVARFFGVECVEIRTISNIASDRNMQPENIQKALNNLETFLKQVDITYHL